MARRTVALCVEEVPFYALLPREQVEGEIADLVREHLRLFLLVLREGRLPTETELAGPISKTLRRAGESAPLAAVLTAYRIGGRLGWQELTRLARPEDTDDLKVAGAYLLEYLQTITNAIATAYLEEEKAVLAERREARRALIQALLAGESHTELIELGERAAVPLASHHLVLTLRLPEPPASEDPPPAMAVRRQIGRIRDELDAFARTPVLSALDARGGVALLPVPTPATPVRDADLAPLAELVDRIGAIAGGRIFAGAADAPEPAKIPAAAEEAREVAMIAAGLGHAPGLHTLDDVLLEFQLTRPGPARDRLARRLDPLAVHPGLLHTLRTFLRLGNHRRQAAKELHVHPNTLDYRLRRVAAFTGLDPLAAPDARLLAAALIARSLHPAP